MRQPHGGLDGFVEHLHAVVLLERRDHPAHHRDGADFVRFAHLHDLKRRVSAGSFSMCRDTPTTSSPRPCAPSRAQARA